MSLYLLSHETQTDKMETQTNKMDTKLCFNCSASHASAWRNVESMILCNACALHYRKFKKQRLLRTPVKSRKRKKKVKVEIVETIYTTVLVDETSTHYQILDVHTGKKDALLVNVKMKHVLLADSLCEYLNEIQKYL